MFEFILQDPLDGFAQGLILVGMPEGEILSDSVDFDGFQDEMDRGGPEQAEEPCKAP